MRELLEGLASTYTAYDVQPSPAGQSMCSIEVLVDCRLEIATKCGAKGCGHVEYGNPLREFGFGVPTP